MCENPTDHLHELQRRVDELERVVVGLKDEVVARRFVVDAGGGSCLVAEVIDHVLELRLELDRPRGEVILFAVPTHCDMPAGIGLQVRAGGNEVLGLNHWFDDDVQ